MPKKRNTRKKRAKTGRNYKAFVFTFIALTLIMFLFIIYYSFSNTTITVYPKYEAVEESLTVIVKESIDEENNIEGNFLEGSILEKETQGTKTAANLSLAEEVPAQAEGKVTIYNNWSQTQPLAATTRLLTESGILFRTKERIDVPPKGSVEAEVYADQKGAEGNIGPSKFTIPGLSSQMQSLVYAESQANISGGTKSVSVVTQEAVTELQNELIEELKSKAINELREEAKDKNNSFTLTEDRTTYEIIEKTITPQIGEESDTLSMDLKIKLIAIAFSINELENLVKTEIESSLSSELKLSSNNFTINCAAENFNLEIKEAVLKITASAISEIRLSSPIFNRENLTNKDKQDIISYFSDFDAIEKVEVKFTPFWVFKSPALENHIEIQIK